MKVKEVTELIEETRFQSNRYSDTVDLHTDTSLKFNTPFYVEIDNYAGLQISIYINKNAI